MLYLFAFFSILISMEVSTTAHARSTNKPAIFLLAGDSTTAIQGPFGGGWGPGFLNTTLRNGARGVNYGLNGATTVTFRESGMWDRILGDIKETVEDYQPWVTIQFGHNDLYIRPIITLKDYAANLARFVVDVREAGGSPILVTPISRREYAGTPERIVQDLEGHRRATLDVAAKSNTAVIDLNKASTTYLNAIGSANAWTYNLKPIDQTHLNEAGSLVFGNMVAWLMDQESGSGEELRQWTLADKVMVDDFKKGVYVYPSDSDDNTPDSKNDVDTEL